MPGDGAIQRAAMTNRTRHAALSITCM